MELFRAQGAGHLVLISSVASIRGMPGTRTAYGASKAARQRAGRGHPLRRLGQRITVTTILPGYIATDINVGRRGPMTVDLDKGVDALTAAIEREPVKAYVPGWPWRRSPGCCGCCRCRSSAASPVPVRRLAASLRVGETGRGLHQQIRIGRPRRRGCRPRRIRPRPPASRCADQAAAQASRASTAGTPAARAASASSTSITARERAHPLGQPAGGALPVADRARRARGTPARGAPRRPGRSGGSPSASSSERMAGTRFHACADSALARRPRARSPAPRRQVVGAPSTCRSGAGKTELPAPASRRRACDVARRGRRRPTARSACRSRRPRRPARRGRRRRRAGASSVTARPSSSAPTQRAAPAVDPQHRHAGSLTDSPSCASSSGPTTPASSSRTT